MAVIMRAMVMLLVLVGLPAAWVYYGPLPPRAQRVADRVVELAQDALGWERPQSAEVRITAPRYHADVAAKTVAVEQVEPLLGQLRGLGVLEYHLEKWGNAGQMYRFRCAMPLAQSDEVTRQFEAVADNPKASIEQVVREVSHWQTARLEPRHENTRVFDTL